MANSTPKPPPSNSQISPGFELLAKTIMISEIRVMTRRLQESGEFQMPVDIKFEDLDIKDIKFIRRELRDTLRSLGGGR